MKITMKNGLKLVTLKTKRDTGRLIHRSGRTLGEGVFTQHTRIHDLSH